MNKFKKDGFTWFIDEEKGVCVCKCEDAADKLWEEYRDMTNCDTNFADKLGKWYCTYANQMDRLFGKAKANLEAGEVIDMERGKEIARARLIEKLSAYRASLYQTMVDECDAFKARLEKRVEGNKRITLNSAAKAAALAKGEEWNVCD